VNEYYCQRCARFLGVPPPQINQLLTSPYQQGKIDKHLNWAAAATFDRVSIFFEQGTAAYVNAMAHTAGSAWVEIDSGNRENMVWHTRRAVGLEWQHGTIHAVAKNIRLVRFNIGTLTHGFPDALPYMATVVCRRCGSSRAYNI
jgi:hypothetical protein